MLNFSRPAYCRRSRSAIPTATRDPGLFLFCAPPLAAASWARKKRRLPDAEKVVSFFSCFLRNSPLASRLVPPESLANPRFSRFLPSHPALSRVSQLSCLFTDESASGSQTYTVGIIQQVQHEALDAATQGFQDALTELLGDSVTIDPQNASGDTANCTTIANNFVSQGVDLIMANGTTALQAAATGTSTIPILGTSITEYGVALGIDGFTGTTGYNVSGTSDLAPLDQQAEMLHTWFPDAQTVGLLYCSAEPNSQYQVDTVQGYLEDLGYTCTQYSFSDSNDLSAVASSACTASDVLYVPTDNTAANNAELIGNISLDTGTPIIAGEEGICKGCGVATLTISYYDIGYKTGEMAYDILVNGADPATMPIEYAPQFTPKYNPTMCEALGLTPPDGYEAIAE